jgi:hypothetical protein
MAITLTAPLAVMRVGGQPVGKARNIDVSEDVQRDRLYGIGRFTPFEVPALTWAGTASIGFFLVNLNETVFDNNDIGKALFRQVQNTEQFSDTLLLQEEGIQLDLFRKVAVSQNPNNGVITGGLEPWATISGLFATRENFNITESQVSGRNADFEYINPIIFPG